jgi:hypothetical protein
MQRTLKTRDCADVYIAVLARQLLQHNSVAGRHIYRRYGSYHITLFTQRPPRTLKSVREIRGSEDKRRGKDEEYRGEREAK